MFNNCLTNVIIFSVASVGDNYPQVVNTDDSGSDPLLTDVTVHRTVHN